MTKTYRGSLSVLCLWLGCWIVFTWGAIQDDAFIHLRYADNLWIHHFLTYDGVHANYGSSSLLYVSALAVLRGLTTSPDLPRATSSAAHLLLFGALGLLFARLACRSEIAGKAGLALLLLLCTPSAVRWLDDGMETVVVVGLVSVLAWLLHRESLRKGRSWRRYALMILLSLFAVLLRIELALLCFTGSAILMLSFVERLEYRSETKVIRLCRCVLESLPLGSGCGLALGVIYYTMNVLLPDTALAKSHGIAFWFNPLHDTVYTLASAFSFGAGLAMFWLLTLLLVIRGSRELTLRIALANGLFPLLLAMATLRGQEIQGVRYFAWTFFFSTIWNILELDHRQTDAMPGPARWPSNGTLIHGFLGLILVLLPIESVVMRRVLIHRQETLRLFESQRLQLLQTRRGVASDVGLIGYFSKANLCDLAGLVNGRAASALSSQGRIRACAATNPDFAFVNLSQLHSIRPAINFAEWQICGTYEFTNVSQPDLHYLVVRPSIASEVCRATGRTPESIDRLVAQVNIPP